jgi:hypothetical protein
MITKRLGFVAVAILGLSFATSGTARADLLVPSGSITANTPASLGYGILVAGPTTLPWLEPNGGTGLETSTVLANASGELAFGYQVEATNAIAQTGLVTVSAPPPAGQWFGPDAFYIEVDAVGPGDKPSFVSIADSSPVTGLLSIFFSPETKLSQTVWIITHFKSFTVSNMGLIDGGATNATPSYAPNGFGASTPEPSMVVGLLGLAGTMGIGLVLRRRRVVV